jgi:hypothetical protein
MINKYVERKIIKIIDEILLIADKEDSEENQGKKFILEEKRKLWCNRLLHYVNSGRLA